MILEWVFGQESDSQQGVEDPAIQRLSSETIGPMGGPGLGVRLFVQTGVDHSDNGVDHSGDWGRPLWRLG
jgi:hypothetical protein